MSLKIEFVERATRAGSKIAPLCREYGISRETGYKWLQRFQNEGYEGLEDKSRRPLASPLGLAEEKVVAVLEAREAHPRWGAKKLVVLLQRKYGEGTPSRATIERILKRVGLVRSRRKKSPLSIIERAPEAVAEAPNDIWTVDFKGWWKTQDGARCEPLTVRDAFSRFVLSASAMPSPSMNLVRKEFERLFRKNGIPAAIQCDNGMPFISVQARAGLTQLSGWWVSLGIRIVRSRPACPQDNGAHERMHRDMRADVQAFPSATRDDEQRMLSKWRMQFNHQRPHEALGGKVPADLYRPGNRKSLVPVRHEYPLGWTVRRVFGAGVICVNAERLRVGQALVGYYVALEPLEGTRARLWFNSLDLGELTLALATSELDRGCDAFLGKKHRHKKKAA